ncbi:MAG: metallophosphoesterase [bacterium]
MLRTVCYLSGFLAISLAVSGCPDPEIVYVPSCYDRDGGPPQMDAFIDAGIDSGPEADAAFARVTLMHTTDLHSHASGYSRYTDYTPLDTSDGDLVTGGYARIAGLVKSVRASNAASGIPTLMFDDGDFLMGTFYDMMTDYPISMKFFQELPYTAVNFGNHELDYSPAGVEMLFGNAVAGGFNIPILASNMVPDTSVDATGDDAIEQFFADGVILKKLVLDLPNGLRVGLLGILGPDGVTAAPLADPVTFNNDPVFLQSLVDELRQVDEVDMVAVLSHGGINPSGTGDDAELAASVDGIDVIMSGHYHTLTMEPIHVKNTLVYIPGYYGKWLPRLDVKFNLTAGRIEDYDFEMIRIDDTITGDASIQDMVDTYDASLNALLMSIVGLTIDAPMVEIDFDLTRDDYAESGLCNLAADGIRRNASFMAQLTGDPSPIYHVAAFPAGAARDELYETTVGYASLGDIYNVVPLGISPDPDNQNLPGWPLVSIWVTARELKDMAEVSVSISKAFGYTDLFICFSGMRVDYDPYGPTVPPNRVQAIRLCGDAIPTAWGGSGDYFSTNCTQELDLGDETTLYRVAVDLYSVLFIREVAMVGIDIEPKYSNGSPIIVNDSMDVMNARIDMDGDPTNGIIEMKPWFALLAFMTEQEAFPDLGGMPFIGEIPESTYGATGIAMGRLNPVP